MLRRMQTEQEQKEKKLKAERDKKLEEEQSQLQAQPTLLGMVIAGTCLTAPLAHKRNCPSHVQVRKRVQST